MIKKEETNILEKLINIIYPPKCGICGKFSKEFLCKKCENFLKSQAKFEIIENQDIEKYFDKHLYIFQYEGIIRKEILEYKFKEKTYLYKTFVNFLLKNEKFFEFLKSYDTIIPVPISKKRQKERGYNQSLLIAKELSKQLEIKCINNCLIKTKNVIEQSKLKKEDRIRNIQGIYKLNNKERLKNKNIIIIDDIYTTGSTVNECSKILRQAQPKEICVLTLAKD